MTDSEHETSIISADEALAGLAEDAADETDDAAVEYRDIIVPVQNHGARLDRALADTVAEFSRNYLQQLIGCGCVLLNGQVCAKPSARVKVSDRLRIELKPTPQSLAFRPEAMALDIVFEDEFLLVINKPAGLVVHPAPGNWSGTLLNGLLARDAKAAQLPRAGIVHRLDKDTSGLMVIARQRPAMDALTRMIAARGVSRKYLALAHGAWKGALRRQVDLPVGRDPRNRLRMAVVDLQKNAGKTASTELLLLQGTAEYCLVQCTLQTGRTHQIRVHMAALDHPLVSDQVYGGQPVPGLGRQALHAFRLAFDHPVLGVALAFVSPPPADLSATLDVLGLGYNEAAES